MFFKPCAFSHTRPKLQTIALCETFRLLFAPPRRSFTQGSGDKHKTPPPPTKTTEKGIKLMAVIKLGPMISDIRGSIGGTTFARGPAGIYARGRVKPVDPSSPRQQAVRNAVAYCQAYWRSTLTQIQRDSWDHLGTVSGIQGSLGEKIRLTGAQAFIRTNAIVRLAGGTIVDAAPSVPYEIDMPVLVFLAEETAGVTLESITPALAVGDVLQIQTSAVYSPTRNFCKGPWPEIQWLDSVDEEPIALTTGTDYAIGDRFFMAARLVTALGRVTVINRYQIDVVADPV